MQNYDVIIVGGGPAGLNAALILGRCRRSVLLIDEGRPRNSASQNLHNYLTRDGISPMEFRRLGREEVARYGTHFCDGTVVNARCAVNGVHIEIEGGSSFSARKLLLATGIRDVLPELPGLKELYGISAHHCPYCDGHQWSGSLIAAYGTANAAVSLGLELLRWTEKVILCTNGGAMPSHRDRRRIRQFKLIYRPEKILRLEGVEGFLQRIVFHSGPPQECSALFFKTTQTQRSPLPEKLGCRFDKKGCVKTDRRGRTRVPNLFLAGDANGDVQFAIVAASEGAQAAVAINHELQEEDIERAMSCCPKFKELEI